MKNKEIYIAAEKRRLSFGLALLMHLLLLIFLFFGIHWQNQPVVPVEVELWGDMPAALPHQSSPPPAAPEQKEEIQKESLPVNSPLLKTEKTESVKAVVPKVVPDIVEDKQKLHGEKLTLPLNKASDHKPDLKKQEKRPKEPQVVPPNKAGNKKLNDNPLDLQTILQSAHARNKLDQSATGNLPKSPTAADSLTHSRGRSQGKALESYVNQLKQLIRDKTIYADNGGGNPSAVLKIFVLPDGTIREVHIISAAGDPAFAHARKQALLMMQRLPPLPDSMRFSEQREWTVHTRLRE